MWEGWLSRSGVLFPTTILYNSIQVLIRKFRREGGGGGGGGGGGLNLKGINKRGWVHERSIKSSRQITIAVGGTLACQLRHFDCCPSGKVI